MYDCSKYEKLHKPIWSLTIVCIEPSKSDWIRDETNGWTGVSNTQKTMHELLITAGTTSKGTTIAEGMKGSISFLRSSQKRNTTWGSIDRSGRKTMVVLLKSIQCHELLISQKACDIIAAKHKAMYQLLMVGDGMANMVELVWSQSLNSYDCIRHDTIHLVVLGASV